MAAGAARGAGRRTAQLLAIVRDGLGDQLAAARPSTAGGPPDAASFPGATLWPAAAKLLRAASCPPLWSPATGLTTQDFETVRTPRRTAAVPRRGHRVVRRAVRAAAPAAGAPARQDAADDLARGDFDKAIALDASADNYTYRATLRGMAGDLAGAVADDAKAREIDPTASRLNALAYALDTAGRAKEALALVDPALDSAGDEQPLLIRSKALALGWLGRQSEGIELLTGLITDRPGDADTLDFTCWYRGLWAIGRDAMLADCDRAVTQANYSSSALQSRAIANLRLGRLVEAQADIDAALDLVPGEVSYLLTRGMIRVARGDAAGGKADIAAAERRDRFIGGIYRAAGLL